MITKTTALRLTGLALIVGVAAGCGSAHAAAPAAPPASTSQPAAPASSAPPTAPPASAPASDSPFNMDIGTPVHMTDDSNGAAWDVTLNSVKRFHQGQYDDPAPAGTHYIIVNVTYDVTTGPVDMNEWDWTAKDTNGTVYEVQFVDAGSNGLSANTIQAGKTRGTVILAMTDGKAGTVVYSAGGSEQASWNIPAS